MTEVWKSNPRYYCEFCKCWLADNKPSRDFHHKGKRHQENKEKKIIEIRKKGVKDAKKEKKMSDSMKAMEKAALKAQEADIKANPSLAKLYGVSNVKKDGKSTPLPERLPFIPEKTTPMTSEEKQNVYDSMQSEKAKLSEKLEKHMKKLQNHDTQKKEENLKKREEKLERKEKKLKKKEKMLKKLEQMQSNEKSNVRASKICHWKKLYSDDGYEYYWNEKTGEVKWEKPEEFYDASSATKEEMNKRSKSSEKNKRADEDDDFAEGNSKRVISHEWQKIVSPDGQLYYHNSTTGEATWDKPDGFIEKENLKEETSSSNESLQGEEIYEPNDEDDEDSTSFLQPNEESAKDSAPSLDPNEESVKDPASFLQTNEESETEFTSFLQSMKESEKDSKRKNNKRKRKWDEFESPDGHTYYYNVSTGESTWTKPDDFDVSEPEMSDKEKEENSSSSDDDSDGNESASDDLSSDEIDDADDKDDHDKTSKTNKMINDVDESSASSPSPFSSDNEEDHSEIMTLDKKEEQLNVVSESLPYTNNAFIEKPAYRDKGYGSWETIEPPVEEPMPDLELPPAKPQEVKTIFVEKSKMKFHEKKVTSLGGEFVPFKKLKTTKRQFNFRQKNDES